MQGSIKPTSLQSEACLLLEEGATRGALSIIKQMFNPEPGRGGAEMGRLAGRKMNLPHFLLPGVGSSSQDIGHALLSGSIVNMHGRDYIRTLNVGMYTCARIYVYAHVSVGL